MTVRALLIEDDETIAEPLSEGLGRYGLTVAHVTTGTAGLRGPYGDIVLLDLGLPDMDGIDVCRGIRRDSDVPIIILTARGDEADRVLGLELGADDYLAKPFSIRELVARIRAVTRRTRPAGAVPEAPTTPEPPVYEWGPYEPSGDETAGYKPSAHEPSGAGALGYDSSGYGSTGYGLTGYGSPGDNSPGHKPAIYDSTGAYEPIAPEPMRPEPAPPEPVYQHPGSDPPTRPQPAVSVPAEGGPPPGPLAVDRRTRQVWVGEVSIALSPKEFELLALLTEDPGAVYPRQQILDRVWEPHFQGPTKTLDVHIAQLRRKLGNPAWIQTLRGVGFRLAVQAPRPGPGDWRGAEAQVPEAAYQ